MSYPPFTPLARALHASAALALLALPALAQRATATRLDTDRPGASFSSLPRVAAAGSRVYVVWNDDRNGSQDIYFNRSLDGGATWLAQDVRLDTDPPGAALSARPDVACVGNEVYVVWFDARAGSILNADIYFNRSLDAGTTWLARDVRLDTDAGANASHYPVVCADGARVYVAWLDFRHGFATRDIYFNRSLDRGATWLAQDVRLNTNAPGTAAHTEPRIACDGLEVYVAWSSIRMPPAFDVYLNRSLDGGTTWLPSDVRLDTDAPGAANSTSVSLACASAFAYVAWQDDRHGLPEIYLNRSGDNGATWLAQDVLLSGGTPGASESQYPDVCCDGSHAYVFWEDWRNGPVGSTAPADVFVNRSSDGGATWAGDSQVSHAPPGSIGLCDHCSSYPQAACTGEQVAVCWVDVRAAVPDIYCNRSFDAGVTWLPFDVRLDADLPGAALSLSPAIASAPGAVYVVWEDDRNGATDIYGNVPFGSSPYGAGTPGTGGAIPVLTGGGVPAIGETFTVRAANARGGAPAALLLGVQKTMLPLFGGLVLTLPIAAPGFVLGGTPGVAGAGAITLPFAVPSNTALVGGALRFQLLVVDPGSPGGLAMSHGWEVWIG